MHSVKTTAYDQKIRDKLRINRQFIHKNEKLKRLTIAISSHKYVVPVLRKSDRLHNNHAIITVITIPFVQMTERDERRNWRHIKILFYAIKTISCQIETVGLQTFYGYNLNDFIIFFNLRHILHSITDSSNEIKIKHDT